MTDALDQRFMRLALTLGARGQGKCWPNPSVGAVIVKDGRVVGRGWTQPGGRPHAETVALAQAGSDARGATAYVTLEPCAHHGQTPPCADALIAAGVSRVVVAVEDPDPRVNGGGIEKLENANIDVKTGVCEGEARHALSGFLSRITTGRPFVTLKLASTLDGRIATATGESKWITGPEARRLVHGLRASHDAVMVGGGTVRADDPDLTVRDMGATSQPFRVVLSRHLDLPLMSRLAQTARDVPVWILYGAGADTALIDAWTGIGAKLIEVGVGSDRNLDPSKVLEALGHEGLTRVFCEGGGSLAASLIRAGFVDELYHFTAGKTLGAEGYPMLGAMGVDILAKAPEFQLVDSRRVGADMLAIWRRAGDTAS